MVSHYTQLRRMRFACKDKQTYQKWHPHIVILREQIIILIQFALSISTLPCIIRNWHHFAPHKGETDFYPIIVTFPNILCIFATQKRQQS